MKKILFSLLFIVFFFIPATTYAVENPTTSPNNKIGIHILFDNELPEAAKLVNGNGGDWGYVVIPIQNGDRDLIKWQTFMDEARKQHIIPIIRLASEGDYFNTRVWKKPTFEDIIDFANFLESLHWPTKNRYVIVYNETNRADEWGGKVNPAEYAEILNFAVTVFKSKSSDFFIISGGMDNAAPEEYPLYMNQYTYMRMMHEAVPGIFNQIDAFSSHSYPNPGFSQPPETQTPKSIASFIFERNLIRSLRNGNDIPVFITETGWNAPGISDEMKAAYYRTAFETVWADPGVIAVTPFLLKAGGGPFTGFSFLKEDGGYTKQFEFVRDMPKTKGQPLLNQTVLGLQKTNFANFPKRDFSSVSVQDDDISLSNISQSAFKWILKL